MITNRDICRKQLIQLVTDNNWDIESLIEAVIDIVEIDKNRQGHPLVISCLESVIKSLQQAALDYYVSTK